MTDAIEVDLASAWESSDGVALWIRIEGQPHQVHIAPSALEVDDPYEHLVTRMQRFHALALRLAPRIAYEAEHGWSGPLDYMVAGPMKDDER